MKSHSVDVVVPASTSNLGSGFDTLGIGLKVYNTIRVTERKAKGLNLVTPVSQEEWPRVTRILYEAYRLFFDRARKATFGLDVEISGDIPAERGLGASATLRLGVVAGLNVLAKTKFDRQTLLNLVAELEGHPDNAAPAVFGGFTVAGKVKSGFRYLRFSVPPRATFVTLIPRVGISTDSARELVPHTFNKIDAIHGLNRSALITAAFASGDLEQLRGLFDDRIHQPHRESLIPQLSKVIQAGEKAGAIGGWLSGAGSGIICLTLKKPESVARAMRRQLPDSDVSLLKADNEGFRIA
ncbi:MAG: homoserine kinase [Verrucomicrobia bacterium]|nr:homoserine kinase [Verrucomicrobiota bacterium]MBI3869675.1 homoserine kinase [Verrucomicrobiota bacterium]